MSGGAWDRKMRTYFSRIDFDKDGSITKKDFEGMANRFISSRTLDEKKGQELKHTIIQIWDRYLKNVAGDKSLTQPLFIEALREQVKNHDAAKVFAGPLPLFFTAVDADGDKQIQANEFANFFEIIGLDPKMAADSFKAIDTNHDGNLSLEEFVTAGTEFFMSQDDKNPSSLFWGPLVA